ncbi:MAG TPA: MBL fold metallo-hydrolase [Casimicrobiaceae bacterium]|nr:MBL fold metallo-hydrolase [Casimicrobiaceae bacterium]
MANTQVVGGLWQIGLGGVNAFLLDDGELTLIDTGVPKSEDKIVAAIQQIGKNVTDLKHIIVTHCHPDHAGSVAALKRMSGARVYMHPVDAAMVRKGECARPMTPSPGLIRKLMFRLFVKPMPIEACAVDQEINDGTELPIAGGLKAIHIPGQCAGQVALLWPKRRLLFVADACANMPTFGYALGYENFEDGKRSLRKLAALDFDVAVFGHGNPIKSGASQKFRQTFAS